MKRFITTGDTQLVTVIQKNVQSDLIEPFIDIAQPMYVLRILGTAQYESLQNEIDSVGLTGLTGYSYALIQQIKTGLSYATFYEALPFLWAKITNKGVELKQSDNSNSVDKKDLDSLRANVRNWMEFFFEELKRYLRINQTNYPLWREDIFSLQEQFTGATTYSTNYFSGIQFDKRPDGSYRCYDGYGNRVDDNQ